jgi:hypothetical protein
MPRVGLGFADDPSPADTADRALDAQPAARQDIGPAQRGGLTEPEPAEGEDEQQCAIPSGSPVPPQLFRKLQCLYGGECAGRPGGLRRAGAAQPARVGGDGFVGDRHVEDGSQEPVRLGQGSRARRSAGLGMPGADGGRGDLVDGDVRPRLGEVVAPQARVQDAGALPEVGAGEVVLAYSPTVRRLAFGARQLLRRRSVSWVASQAQASALLRKTLA